MSYYTYIIQSEKDHSYYIGSSKDAVDRLISIIGSIKDILLENSLGNWCGQNFIQINPRL